MESAIGNVGNGWSALFGPGFVDLGWPPSSGKLTWTGVVSAECLCRVLPRASLGLSRVAFIGWERPKSRWRNL